jgi:hypothetical protein
MNTAPEWFVKALAAMDPLMSIRRSIVTSHWVLERKAVILSSEIETLRRRRDRMRRWISSPNQIQQDQIKKNTKEWESLVDEVCSAEQQKRVICRPRFLDQKVYNDLCQADFQRYGGFARYCTELEQEEERLEAEQERILSNKRQAMNAEVYDMLDFLYRKRGAALDHGHQDLKYLLHGQHTKNGDKPIVTLSDF